MDLHSSDESNLRLCHHGCIFKIRWTILGCELAKHAARDNLTCVDPRCHGTNGTQMLFIVVEGVDVEWLNL